MGEIPVELEKFKGATREKVRRALVRVIETQELRASTKLVSVAKVRGAGGGDQNCITETVRAWRAGRLTVAEAWDGTPDAREGQAEDLSQLADRMRAAASDADRTAVLLEASAHALELRIPAGLLQALTGALNAARQSDKEARQAEPEEVEKILAATEEAVPLVEAFEGITSEVRRKLVLDFAQEQLVKDMAEGPKAIQADEQGGGT